MSARFFVEAAMLCIVVISCWLGSLGMVRMQEPMQSMHYLSLPACLGSVALVVAVFLRTGNSQASWKSVIIALILLMINSIGTHAAARAFRTRDLGHWQPRPEDNVERVPRTREHHA